jgi:hypothetical protein
MQMIYFLILNPVVIVLGAAASSVPKNVPMPLDDVMLEAISFGADKIVDFTDSKDVLVFLGNSASYFYHGVRAIGKLNSGKKRDSFLVPISGASELSVSVDHKRSISGELTIWSKIWSIWRVRKFRNTFIDPIVEQSLGKRIVLIDFSWTGKGVENLHKIFQDAVAASHNKPEIVFLNLTTKEQHYFRERKLPNNIETIREVILKEHCLPLFNGKYQRLVPDYKFGKWLEDYGNILAEFHATNPDVPSEIQKIQEDVRKFQEQKAHAQVKVKPHEPTL